MTTIRAMRPNDYAALLEIARALAAWFSPVDQMALAIDAKEHDGLVAMEGGEIIAFLTYHLLDKATAELSWFGTHPSARGRGVGSMLLGALEGALRSRGVGAILLSTIPADHDATFKPTNDFYLHRGFTVAARDEDFYGLGRPRYLFEKQL